MGSLRRGLRSVNRRIGGDPIKIYHPVSPPRITSGYGDRTEQVKNIPGATKWHPGYDYGRDKSKPETKILAAADGTVELIYFNKYRGNVIILRHDKRTQTLYQHIARVLVAKGQTVKVGQEIAIMGNTGIGSGIHLHFELRIDGKCVDPTEYLKGAEKMTKDEAKAIVKEKTGLSDATIQYIADDYRYGDALIVKLAEAMV